MSNLQPWRGEPHWDAFIDQESGYQCALMRGGVGAWCGYVFLPAGHPAHGLDWTNQSVDVHGGVTLSEASTDGRWLVGFDTAHCYDFIPGERYDNAYLPAKAGKDIYRTFDYVKEETRNMARQFKNMEASNE